MAAKKPSISQGITDYRRRRQEAGVGNYENPMQKRYESIKAKQAKASKPARQMGGTEKKVLGAVEHAVGHVERVVAPRKFAQKAQAKRSAALQNAYLSKYGSSAATPRQETSGGVPTGAQKNMWETGKKKLPTYATKKSKTKAKRK